MYIVFELNINLYVYVKRIFYKRFANTSARKLKCHFINTGCQVMLFSTLPCKINTGIDDSTNKYY